jgi:hypothetical protein
MLLALDLRIAALVLVAAPACAAAHDREVEERDAAGHVIARAHETRGVDGAYVRHGPFEAFYADGTRRAAGEYRSGARSGAWTTFHANGALESRGAYLDDAAEGVWIWRQADGALDAERTGVYEAGLRIDAWPEEGVFEGPLRSGGSMKSEFAHGLRHGRTLQFYASGAKEAEGRYADGLREGAWSYWKEDGTLDPERSGWYADHDKVRDLAPGEQL